MQLKLKAGKLKAERNRRLKEKGQRLKAKRLGSWETEKVGGWEGESNRSSKLKAQRKNMGES